MSCGHFMQSDGAVRRFEAAPSPHYAILLANVGLVLGVSLLVFGATKPLAVLSIWSNRRRMDDSSTMVLDRDSSVSFPLGDPDCFPTATNELTTLDTCLRGFAFSSRTTRSRSSCAFGIAVRHEISQV